VGGKLTNSLAVHYLAFHRKDVPESELVKIGNLPFGEADPTEEQLQKPHRKQ
jgi:hypothetical protein